MKRIIRTLSVAAAVLVLAAAIEQATTAYTTYGTWATPSASFYVNPVNRDVSENAMTSGLQGGMEVWNTQSGTPFRFSYAGRVNDTTNTYDRRNVIIFRNDSNGSSIASTYSWRSNGSIVDADIVFWDGAFKFFTGSSGCSGGAYVEDIAAHELGHALGLLHSDVREATMYPSYTTCSQTQRTLGSDDIAAVRSLYGSGGGSSDTAPSVTIVSPANGASAPAGAAMVFSGSANDTPDGDMSSDLVWSSNIDGQIGTGASFSRALTAGSHTISATATDSKGQTTKKNVSVNVTSSTNTAPSVTISSPANGSSVPAGTSMSFSGSASDTQNGSLTTALAWRSNIDGQIGTGGSFTKALTAGTHTVTASATDSGGMTGQRSITVSVSGASSAGPATLSVSKDNGQKRVLLSWSGLSGESVDVYRNGTAIRKTNNDGSMNDSVGGKGNYWYKVCSAGTSTCTNQASITF